MFGVALLRRDDGALPGRGGNNLGTNVLSGSGRKVTYSKSTSAVLAVSLLIPTTFPFFELKQWNTHTVSTTAALRPLRPQRGILRQNATTLAFITPDSTEHSSAKHCRTSRETHVVQATSRSSLGYNSWASRTGQPRRHRSLSLPPQQRQESGTSKPSHSRCSRRDGVNLHWPSCMTNRAKRRGKSALVSPIQPRPLVALFGLPVLDAASSSHFVCCSCWVTPMCIMMVT